MAKRRGLTLPHLFNEVLDAIALLKESKGSTEKSILKQVDTILHLRRKHLKKSIGSIHRALRHGLKTGLLRLKNGKYCLGMSAADFKIYRKVQRLRSTDNLYKEFKTNRKKGGKGKRRDKRRKSSSSEEIDDSEDESDLTSYCPSSAGSNQPQDRGRRRGGRRRGKRRKSKRRRRAIEIVKPDNDEKNKPECPEIISQKSSDNSIKTTNTNFETNLEVSKSPPASSKYENNDGNQTDRTHTPNTETKCDNPNCLCNSQKSFHDRKTYE